MSSISMMNPFAAIADEETNQVEQVVEIEEDKPEVVERTSPNTSTKSLSATGKSWADMSMEDDNAEEELDLNNECQFPQLNETPEDVQQKKEMTKSREIRERHARNRDLGKLQKVTIRYGQDESKERELKVMTAANFQYFEKLLSSLKTHTKDGWVNKKDQAYKVKVANETLLTSCYKHPKKPFCFVYAIAEIHLGEGKVIRTNNVKAGTKNHFDLVCREYYTE